MKNKVPRIESQSTVRDNLANKDFFSGGVFMTTNGKSTLFIMTAEERRAEIMSNASPEEKALIKLTETAMLDSSNKKTYSVEDAIQKIRDRSSDIDEKCFREAKPLSEIEQIKEFISHLKILQSELFGSKDRFYDEQLNMEIIANYASIIFVDNSDKSVEIAVREVRDFWHENQVLVDKFVKKEDDGGLFSQPVSLVVYYLVEKFGCAIWNKWNIGSIDHQLAIVYSHLGVSTGSNY